MSLSDFTGVTDCHPDALSSISALPLLEPDTIEAAAKRLVEAAAAASPPLEARLKYLADVHNGTMRGLEFKVKPLTSLIRKMGKMQRPGMTIEQLVEMQYDVLRFTIELPISHYVEGTKQVLRELEQSENCTLVEAKNYWQCLSFRGINTIFMSPTNVRFELQLHTPESFSLKQNQTHILYEALRREVDPVKQNLFFSDMISMWDSVAVPPGVTEIGQLRHQPLPERKMVSAEQQAMIDRVWSIKQVLRSNIAVVRRTAEEVDPYVTQLITYACTLHHCSIKELDSRFKGSLKMLRKVENELRRKINVHVASHIHEVELPDRVDGLALEDFLQRLCRHQADVLLYKVVCERDTKFASSVIGIIDVIRKNGLRVVGVSNYFGDLEKHHGISITVLIPATHAIGHEAFFRVEFHTPATYASMIERRTALQHIEESMYERGEAVNKTACDMHVRWDVTLMRRWKEVKIPEGALEIGVLRTQNPADNKLEETTLDDYWPTPEQRREQASTVLRHAVCGLLGLAVGLVLARKFASPQCN